MQKFTGSVIIYLQDEITTLATFSASPIKAGAWFVAVEMQTKATHKLIISQSNATVNVIFAIKSNFIKLHNFCEVILVFYDNYVRLCNSVGKTPSAVATEIGIQKSTVTRWSKGSTPNRATAMKVADYFEVSVDCILGIIEDVSAETFSANLSRHMTDFDDAEKLAKSTGIPLETVNGLIAGEKQPSPDEVNAIAKYLMVEREDLTDVWSEPLDGFGTYTIEEVDFDTYDIVGKYRGLTPAQKRATRQIIETFLWGAPGKWKY